MICPACKSPLVGLEFDRIEVDYCIACKGVWLDSGELELLLESAANRDQLMSTLTRQTGRGEKKVRCPICSKRMDKVSCGTEEQVCLDKCPKGHGLWFDGGELEQVLGMGNFPADSRVSQLLAEVFGNKEKS